MRNRWRKTGTNETSVSVSFIGYRRHRDRKIPKNRYQRQKLPALPNLSRASEMQLVRSFQQNLPPSVQRLSVGPSSPCLGDRRIRLHVNVALGKRN